jgi:hypothetical protein
MTNNVEFAKKTMEVWKEYREEGNNVDKLNGSLIFNKDGDYETHVSFSEADVMCVYQETSWNDKEQRVMINYFELMEIVSDSFSPELLRELANEIESKNKMVEV